MNDQPRRPPPPRRRLDPDARRAEIVEAAREVFLALGFSATTYRAVAEAAGASEPLVYRYFPSKDEMFEVAVREPLESMMKDLEVASSELLAGDEGELAGRLERFHQHMLTGVAKLTPLLGVALFAGDTDSRQYYNERMRPLIGRSATALRTVLATAGSPDFAVPVVVYALYGAYFGVDMNAMLRGKELDVADTSRQLAKLLTHGLNGRYRRSG